MAYYSGQNFQPGFEYWNLGPLDNSYDIGDPQRRGAWEQQDRDYAYGTHGTRMINEYWNDDRYSNHDDAFQWQLRSGSQFPSYWDQGGMMDTYFDWDHNPHYYQPGHDWGSYDMYGANQRFGDW